MASKPSPSLLPGFPELEGLASQPPSCLLDELKVLEELILLLDSELGPGRTPGCKIRGACHLVYLCLLTESPD